MAYGRVESTGQIVFMHKLKPFTLAIRARNVHPVSGDQQTQASLRDPVELVDMVGTLGNLIKDLGTSGDKDEPMGEAEADEVLRVAAFCQQILLGFLRIAHKTDAELAARFAVLIGGAA